MPRPEKDSGAHEGGGELTANIEYFIQWAKDAPAALNTDDWTEVLSTRVQGKRLKPPN